MTDLIADAAKALEGVSDRYLIWKQGAYYRPNSQGYTTSAIQAGRYTLAEAEDITHPNGPEGPRDGMGYVHEDEVIDTDWRAYQALVAELTAHKARADAAEAREAALLANNQAKRETLIRHNAAHATKVADLTSKLEAMRTALEPLAAMAERYDPDEGDDGDLECWSGLAVPKIHHLRAARAALARLGGVE